MSGRAGALSRGAGRCSARSRNISPKSLRPGDTFLFAGKVLRFEGIRENECFVSNGTGARIIVPSYAGGKFPLSTYLAEQVRGMLADPSRWKRLPEQVADWLRLQKEKSVLPGRKDLLVETFPRGNRHYMVAYPFEGRLAHQTLGMLLTRRLERAGARPLGFVATDYSLAVWALDDMAAMFRREQAVARAAVRRGHAWRRSRRLAERKLDAQADVPQLRGDFRPDREAVPRPGEKRPPGHGLVRPDLRRAEDPRARPHPAAGDPDRCRERPARCQQAERHALAHPRSNHA